MQSSLYRSLVIVILAQGVMLGFMPHLLLQAVLETFMMFVPTSNEQPQTLSSPSIRS